MTDGTSDPNIAATFEEFLAEQKARLAPKTYQNYEAVIGLFTNSLNNYAYQSLNAAESKRFAKAFENDEQAYVKLFGPDKVVANAPEFLGYYMIRKVMASEDLLRAAGTVTKKLAKWLGERGYIDDAQVDDMVELGTDAARDLPKAQRLADILFEETEKALFTEQATEADDFDDDEVIDDYLLVERVEPGVLWFEDGIGPVKVPKAASDLAQPGWTINVVLAASKDGWTLLEVGNVYP